jgi:uncharacterized protein YjbI with pentapeptide repeats
MNEIIHELPLATIVEHPSIFSDPMISLELAAITLTLMFLAKVTLGSPAQKDSDMQRGAHRMQDSNSISGRNIADKDFIGKDFIGKDFIGKDFTGKHFAGKYFAGDLLQYVNVGNLISWPKRSLSNQRVLRQQ